MGLYNFQPRFVHLIQSGEKTHTIRAKRKHPDKPGDTLYLYTGLRHKGARRLMVAECVKVETIQIIPRHPRAAVVIDDQMLSDDETETLARRDGFQSFGDMIGFWMGRLPFSGHVIHWKAVETIKR